MQLRRASETIERQLRLRVSQGQLRPGGSQNQLEGLGRPQVQLRRPQRPRQRAVRVLLNVDST